jgi:hypothetical protein
MDGKCEPIHVALESSPLSIGEQGSMMICRNVGRDLDGNRLAQLLA